jgi:hypothetical protein
MGATVFLFSSVFLLYIYILWTRIPKSTLGSQPTHAAVVSPNANLDRPMFVDAGHGQGQGQDQDQNQSAGRQSTQAPPGYAQIPLPPQSGFDGDWRFANPGAPSSALTNRSADSGIMASPYEFLSQRSVIADRIDVPMASRAANPPYGRDLSGRSLRATTRSVTCTVSTLPYKHGLSALLHQTPATPMSQHPWIREELGRSTPIQGSTRLPEVDRANRGLVLRLGRRIQSPLLFPNDARIAARVQR